MFQGILRLYEITLAWVLRHQFLDAAVDAGDDCASPCTSMAISPRASSPSRTRARYQGPFRLTRAVLFRPCGNLLQQFVTLVGEDPAVGNVVGIALAAPPAARSIPVACSSQLKPLEERQISADQVMRPAAWQARPRARRQTLHAGQPGSARGRTHRAARSTSSRCRAITSRELNEWARRVLNKIRTLPVLTDVNSRPAEPRT